MPEYICDVLGYRGERCQVIVAAPDLTQAHDVATRRYGIILSIKLAKRDAPSIFIGRINSPRLKKAYIVDFCTLLAGYLEAGIPLRDALELIGNTHLKLRNFTSKAKEGISSGFPLDVALQRSGYELPSSLLSVVRAALAAGTLPQTLRDEGEFLRKAGQIKTDSIIALSYPVVLLIVTVIVLGMLMFVVVPQVRNSLSIDAMRELPTSSRLLFSAEEMMSSISVLNIAISISIIFIISYVFRLQLGSVIEDVAFKLPVIGYGLKHLNAATFCRTLGTLLKASVRAEVAWSLSADTVSARSTRDGLKAGSERIAAGESISAVAYQLRDRLPADLGAIFQLGERTGTLPEALIRTADRYSKVGIMTMQKISAAAAPIVIIFLGLVIGVFAIGIMSAILSVNNLYGR